MKKLNLLSSPDILQSSQTIENPDPYKKSKTMDLKDKIKVLEREIKSIKREMEEIRDHQFTQSKNNSR